MRKTTTGFTIVELLIVIIVIAILATISIVAYRGIQERARASEASAGLAQAKKKLELYKVDNTTYPTTGNLASAGITDTDVSYQYTSDGTTYCITGTVGTTSYKTTNTGTPEQGGCAGHGVGGQEAITNLAVNPRGLNVGGSISPHDSTGHPITKGVTVPATPDGITTAVEGRRDSGDNWLFSVYNIDGLGITSGKTRTVSLWVRINATGYNLSGNGFNGQSNLPANTWIRLQSPTLIPTRWSDMRLTKSDGSDAPSGDRAWITGIMVVEGSQHYSFADGNSPNWIWNGTPNNSTSTGPAL